jgi:CDP-diacylglycerol--serine O-phosphatidyltransferase
VAAGSGAGRGVPAWPREAAPADRPGEPAWPRAAAPAEPADLPGVPSGERRRAKAKAPVNLPGAPPTSGAQANVGAPRRPGLSRRFRRGAYLLPSLFTILNVVLGFYALVCGLNGNFQRAALVVFLAAITDSLDGRIARMTGTETEFGKEFDSLADVITFGVTPALLTYLWGVKDLAPRAWLVPLFYVVATASRLARFNVQVKAADSRYFVGLPAPAAAGAICSLLFFAPNAAWRDWMEALVAVSLLLIGTLMVSTFRYYGFKKLDLRRRWSYRMALPLAAVVVVVLFRPEATFLVIAIFYTLSAPASWVWGRLRHRRPGAPGPPAPGHASGPPAPSPPPPEETARP